MITYKFYFGERRYDAKMYNLQRMDNSVTMDDAGFQSLPPWKSNDVRVLMFYICLVINNEVNSIHIFIVRHK